MPTVTFSCTLAQALMTVSAQGTDDKSQKDGLIFKKTGSDDMTLPKGTYAVSIRVIGTSGKEYSLAVTEGGTMSKLEGTLPKDGKNSHLRKLTVPAIVLALLGSVAVPAVAQNRETIIQSTQQSLRTLPTVSDVQSPGLAVSFDATTKDKRGSVALAFDTPDKALTFSITASGPLDKDTGEATPVSLDGLPSDASVELAFDYFFWRTVGSPTEQLAFCQKRRQQSECDRSDFTGADLQEWDRLTGLNTSPWMFRGATSLGRSKFTVGAEPDLDPLTEHHNDWAASASVGRYSPGTGYVGAEVEYERAWEAAGKKICTPVAAVTGAIECRDVILGPPTRGASTVAKLQWRRFFRGGHMAINPMIVQDLSEKVTKLRLPVYFFADDKEGLAGGARVDWDSDSGDARFVLFVGTAIAITD